MYPTEGVDLKVHKIYQEFTRENCICSSGQEVHSKIYLWKKNNQVLKILVGSTKFHKCTLVSQNREILVEAEEKTTKTY